jgi:hypothetical protein
LVGAKKLTSCSTLKTSICPPKRPPAGQENFIYRSNNTTMKRASSSMLEGITKKYKANQAETLNLFHNFFFKLRKLHMFCEANLLVVVLAGTL